MECIIDTKERVHRRALADKARALIARTLPVSDADGSSLTSDCGGFHMQIAFSELHPLMAFCLARALNRPSSAKDVRLINELNLRGVLGSHAVNAEAGCYSYRAVHWLDTELTEARFLEILKRSMEEAERAYAELTRGSEERT
jgi:hypothetical protein